jgi:hypothetical protein
MRLRFLAQGREQAAVRGGSSSSGRNTSRLSTWAEEAAGRFAGEGFKLVGSIAAAQGPPRRAPARERAFVLAAAGDNVTQGRPDSEVEVYRVTPPGALYVARWAGWPGQSRAAGVPGTARLLYENGCWLCRQQACTRRTHNVSFVLCAP